VLKVLQLVGVSAPAGGGRGGGGGFGGGGRSASTGDYLVVLQLGGQTIKQTLRVEDRTNR
jgi:hypothetical protein